MGFGTPDDTSIVYRHGSDSGHFRAWSALVRSRRLACEPFTVVSFCALGAVTDESGQVADALLSKRLPSL